MNPCTVGKCICMRTHIFYKCLGNNTVPISCLQWNCTWSQSNFHGMLYVLKSNALFWVFLFWYSAITALDRAPQHNTNPLKRIMLQAFYSQRLFAKALLMPALIFCRSRIYMQPNYISVKYMSDPQTEPQVVSVLNKSLHSQWNQGIIKEGIHPTTKLRRHSPCIWSYSRSRYCRLVEETCLYSIYNMWRYVPGSSSALHMQQKQ